MELREVVTQDRYTILNEKSGDDATMTILAPWTEAGVKNQNERTYPLPLLQRETARVQGLIEKGSFLGMGDHPRAGHASVADTSHIVRKLWLDSGGKGWAELKILPTMKGKNIMEIIRGGGQLGISTRGFGKTNDKGIVQDDYKLMGIDIVCAPSFTTATFSAKDIISESLAFEDKKFSGVALRFDTGKTPEEVMKVIYQTYKNLGKFSGTFDQFMKAWSKTENRKEGGMKDKTMDEFIALVYQESDQKIPFEIFKREYGTVIQATVLVEEGKYSNTEQALRALGESEERIEKLLKQLKPRKRYTALEVRYEALSAGIDPQIFADKLNEKIEKENADDGFPFTIQLTANIIAEASRAGVDITDPEQRKRYLEICYKQKQETEAAKARQLEEAANLTAEEQVEIEKKKKEKIRENKISSLVRELTLAGGNPEKIRQIIKESLEE